MKRIYSSDQTGPVLLAITPHTAGWKYISFKVVRLAPGEEIEGDTSANEVVIVPLVGQGQI